MDYRVPDRSNHGAIIGVALLLAFAPHVGGGQSASMRSSASATQASRQVERLAIRAIHEEFAKRGVTDWATVGLDPDVDAALKPLSLKRDSAQVRELLTELDGRRFSRDSVAPNSFHCSPDGLTRLVYLSAPSVVDDSATVRVLDNLEDEHTKCRFFIESKTLSFTRRSGVWVYTGQGAVIHS